MVVPFCCACTKIVARSFVYQTRVHVVVAMSAQILTTASTTPRTSRRYLDELTRLGAASVDLSDVVYTEGKIALGDGDVETARSLFQKCPPEYRHTARYIAFTNVYDDLCATGIIHRPRVDDVHTWLMTVLHVCDSSDHSVRAYANTLVKHGYNVTSLDSLNVHTMQNVMSQCKMQDGHRALFERHVVGNVSSLQRFVHVLTISIEQCTGFAKCITALRAATTPDPTSSDARAEE